jgi:molybdate transport system ATP-binding protein
MNAFDLHARYPGFTLAAAAQWQEPCVALFGPSGSGKSTIVEAIAGLRPDVQGTVCIGGEPLQDLRPRRRRLGWVPQDAALFPHRSVAANLAYAARRRGAAAGLLRRVADALELGPLLDRRPHQLSGGERQRVALGRALVGEPRALLLDEPLAAIDRPLRTRLVPFLRRIQAEFDVPMWIVSHDPLEVIALARWVVVLAAGRVVAQGDPRAVLQAPEAFGSLLALAAENVFAVAAFAPPTNGIAHVRTQEGLTLAMVVVPGQPAPQRVALRAEDVVLATEAPRGVSAQNVLPGHVVRMREAGDQVAVTVAVDAARFAIRVTAGAAKQLGLEPGRTVHLLFKAHAVLALE